KVGDKGMVQVIFHPLKEGAAKDTYPAAVKPDGTFEVGGKDGRGIPEGKYRVEVHQWDPYPKLDRLGVRFGANTSPIEINVAGARGPAAPAVAARDRPRADLGPAAAGRRHPHRRTGAERHARRPARAVRGPACRRPRSFPPLRNPPRRHGAASTDRRARRPWL